MYNVVNTSPFILVGSSLLLRVTRTPIKSLMSSIFGRQPWTAELAALDRVTKYFTYLRTIQNILMTCWLTGERLLPFGLLVYFCKKDKFHAYLNRV